MSTGPDSPRLVTSEIDQAVRISSISALVAIATGREIAASSRPGADTVRRVDDHASRPFQLGTSCHCGPLNAAWRSITWKPAARGTTTGAPPAAATRAPPTSPETIMSRPVATTNVPSRSTVTDPATSSARSFASGRMAFRILRNAAGNSVLDR
ncbi:MAG: hypothetical protein DMF98_21760 [Acidobacteria bacterium]|nr:MAG: hypothetical protein DMF98_21760 [Acidobacteriota bacterium]